jgi:hypothetical protein
LALWAGWPVVAAPGKQGNCRDGCRQNDDNVDGTRKSAAIKMLPTIRILIGIGRNYSPGNSPGNQRQSGYSCSNFVSQLHLTSFLIVHLRTGNYSGMGSRFGRSNGSNSDENKIPSAWGEVCTLPEAAEIANAPRGRARNNIAIPRAN